MSCEPYHKNLLNREALFDNLLSSSRRPNTVHTAAPQMSVRVCSQLYSSPPVMSVMNHVPRYRQIGKNEGHALRFENEAAPYEHPRYLYRIEPQKSEIDSYQSHRLKSLTATPWITRPSLIDLRCM